MVFAQIVAHPLVGIWSGSPLWNGVALGAPLVAAVALSLVAPNDPREGKADQPWATLPYWTPVATAVAVWVAVTLVGAVRAPAALPQYHAGLAIALVIALIVAWFAARTRRW